MSETYQDEHDESEALDTDEHEGEDQGEQSEGASEAEKRARGMGWDPDGELDAEAFIERQDSNVAAMRKKIDSSEARLEARLEAQQKDFDERAARIEAMTRKALDKQREKLTADFARQKRQAAESGDMEAYDRIETEERESLSEPADETETETKHDEPKTNISPAHRRVVDDWRDDNTWFGADEEMTAWASARHAKLLREKPGMTLAENLEAVTEAARDMWPDKFGKRRSTNGAGRIEGGRRGGGGGKRSNVSKLPKEAKQQAEAFVEDGTYESVEEYAKDYFEHYPEDLEA